jgi:hypothetical protein
MSPFREATLDQLRRFLAIIDFCMEHPTEMVFSYSFFLRWAEGDPATTPGNGNSTEEIILKWETFIRQTKDREKYAKLP